MLAQSFSKSIVIFTVASPISMVLSGSASGPSESGRGLGFGYYPNTRPKRGNNNPYRPLESSEDGKQRSKTAASATSGDNVLELDCDASYEQRKRLEWEERVRLYRKLQKDKKEDLLQLKMLRKTTKQRAACKYDFSAPNGIIRSKEMELKERKFYSLNPEWQAPVKKAKRGIVWDTNVEAARVYWKKGKNGKELKKKIDKIPMKQEPACGRTGDTGSKSKTSSKNDEVPKAKELLDDAAQLESGKSDEIHDSASIPMNKKKRCTKVFGISTIVNLAGVLTWGLLLNTELPHVIDYYFLTALMPFFIFGFITMVAFLSGRQALSNGMFVGIGIFALVGTALTPTIYKAVDATFTRKPTDVSHSPDGTILGIVMAAAIFFIILFTVLIVKNWLKCPFKK